MKIPRGKNAPARQKEYSMLSLIFSGVVAISTVVYAILTWKLVGETRKMRHGQIEPMIYIAIEHPKDEMDVLQLIVRNGGMGPAYNIKFDLKEDFETLGGHKLSDVGFIKMGIGCLGISGEFRTTIAWADDLEKKASLKILIIVEYDDCTNLHYQRDVSVDLSEFMGIIYSRDSTTKEIARSLKEIQSDIQKLCNKLPFSSNR
jgi:hypothetical protein